MEEGEKRYIIRLLTFMIQDILVEDIEELQRQYKRLGEFIKEVEK